MPSKIQVDQIAGATGSTVTLPSGQTLDLSSGTVNLPSASLSALNATNLTSGTVPSARLSLTSSDLPTVPTTKGGTGLTTIGTASQVLRVNSGATALEYGTISSGVVKKIHSFEFNTRTAGNTSANTDQFTYTSSFTPLDAVNNSLFVQSIVPIDNDGAGNDYAGFGIRFTGNSTSTNYDNFGKGSQYVDSTPEGATLGIQSNHFIVPANTMTNQTYTVKLRTESNDSNANHYCPNSTDGARLATQTSAVLIITEFAN
jgi:hypothetical protein